MFKFFFTTFKNDEVKLKIIVRYKFSKSRLSQPVRSFPSRFGGPLVSREVKSSV